MEEITQLRENTDETIGSVVLGNKQVELETREHPRRSHHHHSKRSQKKKPNKFIAFVKRNKNVLINILSCTISVVLLIIMAIGVDFSQSDVSQDYTAGTSQSGIGIETTIFSSKVSLVNNAISYYMAPDHNDSALAVYKLFEGYKGGLDKGSPVKFAYRVIGIPNDLSVTKAQLEIAESNTYQDARVYNLELVESNVDIYNLKIGCRYYYRLNLTLSDNNVIGTTGSFETENTPRLMNVDGIVNVRDIGGWKVDGGQTIRQGMLYRGSELDGAVETDCCLTEKGWQTMLAELGVRFDMDLRTLAETPNGKDALGKNVPHKYYNAPMYSDILAENNKEIVRSIFSDLANQDNYPIYLHCTYGRDRTGTICYLLEALLGMSDADLDREYELSVFTDSYVDRQNFDRFVMRVELLEGDTTKEKVEGWLLSTGVTQAEIQSIRDIFLDNAVQQ